MNTLDIGTEGKSVLQLERELLRRFGVGREYCGTIEDGYSLIRYLDQVTTAPYNASNCVYGCRELLSLYTKHLYVKAPSHQQQLLTNYEHEDKRPRWVSRARHMLMEDVHSTSGLFIMVQSTIHVWNSAVVVVCMQHGSTGNIHRTVRTSVITSDGKWFTSSLCSYIHQIGTPLEIAYKGFRIIGQDATFPCPIL